jgi:hypothetical protein
MILLNIVILEEPVHYHGGPLDGTFKVFFAAPRCFLWIAWSGNS